ncbi:hypothetical protein [Sphingobium sp. CR28]|uniref:hypothetical protein n=1 Tax=Sphingobium sp. CR28 TaxID=3400272 RepID=UPI003FF0BDCE
MRGAQLVAILAAVALAQPPVTAQARVMTIMMCGGQTVHMVVPGNPDDPEQGQHCPKACHAIAERRAKPGELEQDCC